MRCWFLNVHLFPPSLCSWFNAASFPSSSFIPPYTFIGITSFPSCQCWMTSVPPPAQHFKKRTSSAPKTAAMATASRATVTMTPPTEVIQLVSSGWHNFSQLCSNTRTYTALICRRGVFVIMNRTMQNCWCGSVTSNFLNLEMCGGLTLRCYWLAWKDPQRHRFLFHTWVKERKL